MKMLYRAIVLAAGVLLGLGAAQAQESGSPKDGLLYASKNCTECHAIERDAWTSPNPASPSFQSIAQSKGISWIALTAILQTSHKTMPNLIIPSGNRADVIAYILSLKND